MEDGLENLGTRWGCKGGLDALKGWGDGTTVVVLGDVPVENAVLSKDDEGIAFAPRREGRGNGVMLKVLGDVGNDCGCVRVRYIGG